jgi:hypothetical protein
MEQGKRIERVTAEVISEDGDGGGVKVLHARQVLVERVVAAVTDERGDGVGDRGDEKWVL